MTYRQLLKEIAERYGLEAVEVYDTDMDILLPEGKTPKGLRGELREHSFKYFGPQVSQPLTSRGKEALKEVFGIETENETAGWPTLHVHAPMRKKRSWFDRGWDWNVPGTEGLPGEGPYFGEGYLGESKFGEN